jgi:hypothetical protein
MQNFQNKIVNLCKILTQIPQTKAKKTHSKTKINENEAKNLFNNENQIKRLPQQESKIFVYHRRRHKENLLVCVVFVAGYVRVIIGG